MLWCVDKHRYNDNNVNFGWSRTINEEIELKRNLLVRRRLEEPSAYIEHEFHPDLHGFRIGIDGVRIINPFGPTQHDYFYNMRL